MAIRPKEHIIAPYFVGEGKGSGAWVTAEAGSGPGKRVGRCSESRPSGWRQVMVPGRESAMAMNYFSQSCLAAWVE